MMVVSTLAAGRWRPSAGIISFAILTTLLLQNLAADQKPDQPRPPVVPAVGGGTPSRLSKKLTIADMPKLGPGSQIIATHLLEFETKEGDTILAKVFLVAILPDRSGNPKMIGKKFPPRIFANGFEIEPPTTTTGAIVPDFVVDKRFVEKIPKTSAYSINLGDVKYRVVTAREP